MKKLPIDVSTFSTMMDENYLYIDKTQAIYNLFAGGRRYFFLSRPRRFGKSLLISTLKELFLGKKEHFQDLWIGKQKDFDWQSHPIIHLDFSDADNQTAQELKISLGWMLDDVARQYGVKLPKRYTPKAKLKWLVKELSERNSVVVLVDEYDKPILDHLHDKRKANAQRVVLKNFYDGFKGLDAYLRAVFITGVSKFSKTSIFSGLNNLDELSYENEGALLVGYTEIEITTHFSKYIEEIAQAEKVSSEQLIEKIRYWYNGYQFSRDPIKIYNPFSIVHFFHRKRFENWWFETGTPSFLIELLKQNPYELKDVETKGFSIASLGTFRIDNIPAITLFFQTGYLTIKEYDEHYNVFKLTYPNEEIRQSLAVLELGVLAWQEVAAVENTIYQCKLALEHKDLDSFVKILHSLFAQIPYNLHIDREAYYHSLVQVLFMLLNIKNSSEKAIRTGKIDLIAHTSKYIYVFEFKFLKSAEEALKQILNNCYYEPFIATKKEIILVGVSFKLQDKNLTIDYISQPCPK